MFTLLCPAAHLSGHANVVDGWVNRHDTVVNRAVGVALQVLTNPSGDVLVAGAIDDVQVMKDIVIVKYSGVDGSKLWEARYDGPFHNDDVPTAMAIDSDGNVIVTGSSRSESGLDFYTAKYAAENGSLIWFRPRRF